MSLGKPDRAQASMPSLISASISRRARPSIARHVSHLLSLAHAYCLLLSLEPGTKRHNRLRNRRGNHAEAAHAARKHVGSSAKTNMYAPANAAHRILWGGAESLKLPWGGEVRSCSLSAEAAPTEGMISSTLRSLNVCGEPAMRSATQRTGTTAVLPGCGRTAIWVVKKKRRQAQSYPRRGRRRRRGHAPRA